MDKETLKVEEDLGIRVETQSNSNQCGTNTIDENAYWHTERLTYDVLATLD